MSAVPRDALFDLPDGGRGFERVDGRYRERIKPPWVTLAVGELRIAVSEFVRRSGWVTSSGVTYQCFRDEQTVRRTDVAYHRVDRMSYEQAAKAGHCTIVPDLVCEFVAPKDSAEHVEALCRDWLAAGARLVWIIHAVEKMVRTYQADASVAEFGRNDTLTGDPVLPEFKVIVGELFKLPTD